MELFIFYYIFSALFMCGYLEMDDPVFDFIVIALAPFFFPITLGVRLRESAEKKKYVE